MLAAQNIMLSYGDADINNQLAKMRGHWLPENPAVQQALLMQTAANDNQYDINDYKQIIDGLLNHIKQLTPDAFLDSDTKYLNKNAFNKMLDHIIDEHRAGKNDEAVTVGIIDLNYLKVLNNVSYAGCGDKAIDYMLKYITDRLPDDAILARFGGDEFGIAIKGKKEQELREILQPIMDSMAHDSVNGDNKCMATNKEEKTAPVQISASFGVHSLDFSDLENRPENQGIRAEAFKLAEEEQKTKKIPSKLYAATIKNGYPYCDDRKSAEKILKPILEANFDGKFFANSQEAEEYAIKQNGEYPTVNKIVHQIPHPLYEYQGKDADSWVSRVHRSDQAVLSGHNR